LRKAELPYVATGCLSILLLEFCYFDCEMVDSVVYRTVLYVLLLLGCMLLGAMLLDT